MAWVYTLIYGILAWVDYIIYSLAAVMIRIILLLANKDDFFSPTQIDSFIGRVYVVVGVLMLFKLVISAIQYMINPDTFDDKEKGMGGILQRLAISLALVVVSPAIFNFMISIQTSIVGTLPTLIFGNNVTEADAETKDVASNLSFIILSSFVEPYPNNGGSIGTQNGIHDLESFRDRVTEGCNPNIGQQVIDWIGGAVKSGLSVWGISEEEPGVMRHCKYNYLIIISTAAGVFLCYILLSMALDVSIRAIKFGIIRMLAPIPIAGYVFSKEKLTKFVKTALNVYADLFIRMAIIYFIIFFISQVCGSGDSSRTLNLAGTLFGLGEGDSNVFFNAACNISIIFGLLMFASKAPKFLSELLGLPDVGSGDMADMFKPAWQRAGGAAGALVNPIRTAAASALTAKGMSDNLRGKDSWWKGLRRAGRITGAAIRGFGAGAVDSAQGLMEGDDWAKMKQRMQKRDLSDFKRAYKARYYRTLSKEEARKQKGERFYAAVSGFVGQNPVDSKGYKDASSAINSLRGESFTGRAKGEVDKAPAMFRTISTTTAGLSGGDLMLNSYVDPVTNETHAGRKIQTRFDVTDAAGNGFNNCDYEQLHTLFVKIQNGSATDGDYEKFKYTDADGNERSFKRGDEAIISDIHERVGKKAYSEYVDIAVAAQKRLEQMQSVSAEEIAKMSEDEIKKRNADMNLLTGLADREVLDRIERFKEEIVGLNIPDSTKAEILESLERDPGKWLAGANKKAQEFSTEATRRAKMEQAGNGGGNS